MAAYPRWRYFPTSSPPALWVPSVIDVFAKERAQIDSAVDYPGGMKSDAVLAHVAPGLIKLGFVVETGKTSQAKLPRPVFFGDEGTPLRTYEIDAFNASEGVALEVEAGRATKGNNIYRDLIQGSLMVDARYLALAVPEEYRYGKNKTRERSYANTVSVVDAIYASPRLDLPFDGLLVIGY